MGPCDYGWSCGVIWPCGAGWSCGAIWQCRALLLSSHPRSSNRMGRVSCVEPISRVGLVSCVASFGCMGPFGHVEPCDCVSTSRPSGHVELFGRVGPSGCVSTLRSFDLVGLVGHLVFWLDVVVASYCTKGKRSTGWLIGCLFGWMQ